MPELAYKHNINSGSSFDNEKMNSKELLPEPSNYEERLEEENIKPSQSHHSVIAEKFTLFSKEVRHLHYKVFTMTLTNLIIMCTLILAILSLFWASTLNRLEKAHNLDIWILDFDEAPNSNTPAFVGPSLTRFTNSLSPNPLNLNFKVVNTSDYKGDFSTVPYDTVNEIGWGIIAVAPNASATLMNNLQNPSADFTNQYLVSFYFPEARQDSVYDGVVMPLTSFFSDEWTGAFRREWWLIVNSTIPSLQTQSQIYAVNPSIIPNPIDITFQNLRPVGGPVYEAILSTGLIFLIIVSFFQIPFFAPVHMIFMGKVSIFQYMVYRPLVNFLSLLFLSLAFSLVSLAFQTDFTLKFGHGGFMVYWMVNYFSMMALGGASENVALIIFNTVPHTIGFWLIFWVCLNSSSALAPLELCPKVFQIGKALPVHNTQQALRTILFDTKNHLGVNFAVLSTWIVVNYIVSFGCFAFVRWYKGYQARKAARNSESPNDSPV